MTRDLGKTGFNKHWSSLAQETTYPLCSDGNIGRYCCDPDAWSNMCEDFGERAHGEGGYWAWFGEPMDDRLCRMAVDAGFDPHVVFWHEDLNYKTHKKWFVEHVAQVIALMVEEKA